SFDAAGGLKRLLHANALNQAIEDFSYTFNSDGEIESITSLVNTQKLTSARNASAADSANRIPQFGQQNFVQDEEGRTTSKSDARGTTIYQWDARGRLVGATLPNGQSVAYAYDALGRRSSRTTEGTTTK